MNFWQALAIAAVPTIGVAVTALVAFRDLSTRRRLETSKQFLTLFAHAHGRPLDGRPNLGLAEQLATIHLISDFAGREPVLKNAAYAGLSVLATWGDKDDASDTEKQVATAAKAALPRVKIKE